MRTTPEPETSMNPYAENTPHAREVLSKLDELERLLKDNPKAFVAAARKLSAPVNEENGESPLLDDLVARYKVNIAAGYANSHVMSSDETFLRIARELVDTARILTIHNLKYTGRFRNRFPAAPK